MKIECMKMKPVKIVLMGEELWENDGEGESN
jgi:hypothetical protein